VAAEQAFGFHFILNFGSMKAHINKMKSSIQQGFTSFTGFQLILATSESGFEAILYCLDLLKLVG